MSEYHVPVLLKESVDALVTDPSGFYIDATYGGGGHSAEILSRLSPEGRLMAFDRDSDAIAGGVDDPRLTLIHNNFRFVHNYALLEARKAARDYRECVVDGILADLGVSSHQFDTAERGFSFRYDAPLDMRMNTKAEMTAADVLNTYAQEDLEKIFRLYGEVDNARRLASLVAAARSKAEIRTTGDLDAAIKPVLPAFAEHKYLAKVYQALRIEVNQEMRALGEVPRRRREEPQAGRKARSDHLPLPRGQDGEELHQVRQHRRHRGEGRVRPHQHSAACPGPQAGPAAGERDRGEHPRPQRQAEDGGETAAGR